MATRNRFTYEQQAKLSVTLAALGALATLASFVLLAKNFAAQTFWVNYNPNGMWLPTFGLAMLAALATSFAGLLVGFNSAGQKRNTQSKLAWTGFFVSAGVLALILIAAAFFYYTKNPLVPPR